VEDNTAKKFCKSIAMQIVCGYILVIERETRMAKPQKTLNERIADADQKGGDYLARANEAAERGQTKKAERLYEKGQFWLDRTNKLLGNA
jgi:hypothetical protein